MLHNRDKELIGDKVILAMDDGGRCLLDVIDDPQLLQSFLENTNGALERLESGVNPINPKLDNQSHKALATVKPIDTKIVANLQSMTTALDSKQVDHVTSSGGNSSPILALNNRSTSGQLIIDERQALNMVSSSVGLIPISALNTSLALSQPALTTLSNTTTSMGQITSSLPLRGLPHTWPSTPFQIAGPRGGGPVTVQLPQQLIVPAGAMQMTGPAGLQQLVLTTPRPGGGHGPQLPPGIQPGQLVQIIQTPSGPQILPTNPTATVQSIVSTSITTKSSSTTSSSRSNKQILPKPPGSGVSANNSVTTNSATKQLTQTNTLKVINSLPPNTASFASNTIPTSGSGPQTQQILIGPGGQPMIAGPNGTILLNHMIPGSQPILIQGNIGNVPNSVHLTLRPQSHSTTVMSMGNGMTAPNMSSADHNTTLLNALTGHSAKQVPSQSPQPQTFVIPNNTTAVSSASPGVVMTSAVRSAPNIIFTRPPSLMGSHQPSHQTIPSGQQFLQLQTPNGPILVAIQTQPQLIQQQPNSGQPTHGIQLGNTMIPIGAQHLPSHLAPNLSTSIQTGAHPALHALLTHNDNTNGQTVLQTSVPSVATSNTVILTSQPQIISRPQLQQQSHNQQLKPSVNLAELLKEHGILPECSPPSSPTNNSMTDITTGAVHPELIHPTPTSQQTVFMVPSGPNQPHNLVLTQNSVAPTATPQLRLTLGPDGSVILQPHIANTNGLVQHQIQSQFVSNSNNSLKYDSLKDSSGLGSSQPSPDSTTPSIDSTSTTSANSTVSQTTTTTTMAMSMAGQNTSALLEQLNTGPAVKVPDLMASLALSHSSSVTTTEDSKSIQTNGTLIPLTVQNINNSLEQQKQTILTIPVQTGDNAVGNASNGSSNAVIRISSCDTVPTSLVLTTTPTTVFTSPPKTQTTCSIALTPVLSPNNCVNANGTGGGVSTTTTLIDQNGVPMVQVSPNNQEFLQRLETQLKSLLAIKAPTDQQKELLQELLSLQQKMNAARSQKNNSSEDQKVVLTTASAISISAQTQQALQSTPTQCQTLQHRYPNQSQVEDQTQQTPQNVHLVNLLKQSPVNQTSGPQIRLLTPASTAPVSGTATIQVGNQLITFTTPAKQQLQNLKSIASNQTGIKPSISSPTPAVILRLHTPTPTTTSTFVTTSTTTKTSIIKNDLLSDKERRNAKILKAIQQQLNVDQNAALKPDTKRPFSSRDDACKRLLRYHVFNSPTMTDKDMQKSDHLFEMVSKHLLYKKRQLFDKFRVLLLKQSMKETSSSEHVMIDRMFINEETNSLKADKESVAEGKVLNLPPPPESWYQMIRSTVEEEQKLYINRKRKSSIGSDDEYSSQTNQLRRMEEPVDDSEESDDDEEDSDDDDDNEEKVDSISNFLQSTPETSLGNVGHYYDNFQHNLHVQNGSQSHVPLNTYVDPTQQHNDLEMYSDMDDDNATEDWTQTILNNSSANRRIAWNHRFGVPESEAAVAVESILNADDDDDEEEPDMSVDLSAIEGLDDNLEDDNEDDDEEDGEEEEEEDDDEDEDDEEEDVVNGYGMGGEGHQSQQHVDVQMQCAIKSILDMPSVQSQSHQSHNNSYPFHTHSNPTSHTSHPSLHQHLSDFRNLDYPHIPNLHDQRRNEAILRNYSGHSTGVNDPILDEAVKSILS